MKKREAVRLAIESAAGLLEAMDEMEFFGEAALDGGDDYEKQMEILSDAKRKVVARIRKLQKAKP